MFLLHKKRAGAISLVKADGIVAWLLGPREHVAAAPAAGAGDARALRAEAEAAAQQVAFLDRVHMDEIADQLEAWRAGRLAPQDSDSDSSFGGASQSSPFDSPAHSPASIESRFTLFNSDLDESVF